MPKGKEELQLKVFGYGFSVVFLWMAWGQGTRHGFTLLPLVFLTFSLVWAVLTAIKSRFLNVVFKLWMKAAHGIGIVITAVILTIIYVLVFTPAAVCLRILGKDYMRRSQRDDRTVSYWLSSSSDIQKS